jgi:pyridoxal phosphate enzyme (YggS family)
MTPSVAEAYAAVRRRMREACERGGRRPEEVGLVAISKTFPVSTIRGLLACGHRVLGENRVQEMLPKMDELGGEADWHFVGTLQRNKVRQIVGRVELIHSVDGEKLAREIDRRAGSARTKQPVLLQVNLSGEPTKSGVSTEETPGLVESLLSLEHLELRGLMTVPPPVERPEQNRPWFARLRELRERCEQHAGAELPDLSMGMTDDFEVAIEEGATMIRVGRALFGER